MIGLLSQMRLSRKEYTKQSILACMIGVENAELYDAPVAPPPPPPPPPQPLQYELHPETGHVIVRDQGSAFVEGLIGKHRDEVRGLLRGSLPPAVADTVVVQEHGEGEEVDYEMIEYPGAEPSCLALGLSDDGVVTNGSFWVY